MATMIPYGNVAKLNVVSLTLTPVAIVLNTTAEQTFACPGVRLALDVVVGVQKPTSQAGLGIVNTRVSANDQIGITFSNNTGGSLTPTAGEVYTVTVARIEVVQGNFS